jgi:arylsulfatase A-like enzyme
MRSTPRSIRTTIPAYSAHHGNITQMDDAFGRLMKKLDESGLRENTLVLFTSDNGPAITAQHPVRLRRTAARQEGQRCGRVASACRASCAGPEKPSQARQATSRSAMSIFCRRSAPWPDFRRRRIV